MANMMMYNKGPSYWKKDTMVQDCKRMLTFFNATWPIIHDWIEMKLGCKTKKVGPLPDDVVTKLDRAALATHLSEEEWNQFKKKMYDTATPLFMSRLLVLYEIAEFLVDTKSKSTLTTCTDSDVRDAMIRMCSKSGPGSIKKKVSCARQAFLAMGRKHEWGDRAPIQEDTASPIWANTGCPVSSALQDTLIDNSTVEQVERKSLGGAVKAPMMAWYNIEQLRHTCELVEEFENGGKGKNQTIQQINNACGLGMLIAMLMHTGSRPGNINRLLHEHLYFKGMHKKVYWLTLAFIRPDTLQFLIKNDIIKEYIMKIHNGYKKNGKEGRDELRVWEKLTVPCPYNSLDLPTMFALYWRLLLSVDGEAYLNAPSVFTRPPQTYSAIFGSQNKGLGIMDLVLYSVRYGTAKDDKKNKVDKATKRRRMAHSEGSNTGEKVYETCTHLVTYEGDEEESEDGDMDGEAPTLMNPLNPNNQDNMYFQRNWLDDTFEDEDDLLRQDFEECVDLVSAYIASPTPAHIESLISRIDGRGIDDLDKLSLGVSYVLPGIGKKLEAKHQDNLDTLCDMMDVRDDADIVPHLVDFTSIMYGNWRDLKQQQKRNGSKLPTVWECEEPMPALTQTPVMKRKRKDESEALCLLLGYGSSSGSDSGSDSESEHVPKVVAEVKRADLPKVVAEIKPKVVADTKPKKSHKKSVKSVKPVKPVGIAKPVKPVDLVSCRGRVRTLSRKAMSQD